MITLLYIWLWALWVWMAIVGKVCFHMLCYCQSITVLNMLLHTPAC